MALLLTYVEQQLESALDTLLLTMPLSQKQQNMQILEAAIDRQCWKALQRLDEWALEEIQTQDKCNLFKALVAQTPRCVDQAAYAQCMEMLLGWIERIDETIDDDTLLHVAAQHENALAMRLLLQHGASLAHFNAQRELALLNIPLELLEQHFDDCLSTRGKLGSKDFELTLQYKNFCTADESSALAPILYIAKCEKLHQLLQHPLIDSLLQIKWQRLGSLFYMHFLILLLYSAALIAQVLLRFPKHTEHLYFIYAAEIICCTIMLYNLLNMIFSYATTRLRPNWLEVALLLITLLNSQFLSLTLDWQRFIAVVAIMLMTLNLVQQIGGLPIRSIATHVHMLYLVARNFLMSFAHYSVLLATFDFLLILLPEVTKARLS
ncbi:transient receptor potential cation channel protein painless-like [Drosophila busckii]|uniref:transient receptor potential cation channel protein painless-like n=1 Tax=Drosophila busckii TaxID=30019 RepID=UPI001432E526|nr:transient receptor potential cation channel protein painless-like [Drosophila busckii]